MSVHKVTVLRLMHQITNHKYILIFNDQNFKRRIKLMTISRLDHLFLEFEFYLLFGPDNYRDVIWNLVTRNYMTL